MYRYQDVQTQIVSICTSVVPAARESVLYVAVNSGTHAEESINSQNLSLYPHVFPKILLLELRRWIIIDIRPIICILALKHQLEYLNMCTCTYLNTKATSIRYGAKLPGETRNVSRQYNVSQKSR